MPNAPTESAYDRHKERARQRQAQISEEGRDIGPIPAVADPARRAACGQSLKLFLETYFPEAVCFEWGRDHLRVLDLVQTAIVTGGQTAVAMPRGSGKTTILERAALWAILYGLVRYLLLIAATARMAKKSLARLKLILESNPLLCADFPEVCIPVKALGRIPQRARGQMCQGVPTLMQWTNEVIVLPTIAGSVASGAVLQTGALLTAVRGAQHVMADGTVLRPDCCLVDDPQTRATAKSDVQIQDRLDMIGGDLLGCAGPGKKIRVLIACTIIRPGDAAHRLLNRGEFPDFHGITTKLVDRMPDEVAMSLWDRWNEIREDCLRDDVPIDAAHDFYQQHRSAMDAGSDLPWPQRTYEDYVSPLEAAMELYYKNRLAFFSEYQNDPAAAQPKAALPTSPVPDVALLCTLTSGYARGLVPKAAGVVTGFIDVHGDVLFYSVCGWTDFGGGWVLDYGTWPEQPHRHFVKSGAKSLAKQYPGDSPEAQIRAGIDHLVAQLCLREWPVDGGGVARLRQLLVDANWGERTDLVYAALRESAYAATVLPSHGKYIGPLQTPIRDWARREGDRIGDNWRVSRNQAKRTIRAVVFDANYWKSWTATRLSRPAGSTDRLVVYDAPRAESALKHHGLWAEHLHAEQAELVTNETRQKSLVAWALREKHLDNHWWDCLVGCAVAGSIAGVKLRVTGSGEAPARPAARQGGFMTLDGSAA